MCWDNGLTLCWEELRHFQGKPDVTGDLELAAKEGALWIKFAFSYFQPVLIADGKGHIRFINPTRNQFALAVGNLQSIFAFFGPGNVPLKGLVHACGCRRIKICNYCREGLCNGHTCYTPSHKHAGKGPCWHYSSIARPIRRRQGHSLSYLD